MGAWLNTIQKKDPLRLEYKGASGRKGDCRLHSPPCHLLRGTHYLSQQYPCGPWWEVVDPVPLHSALTPPQSGFFIIHLRGHLVYLLKSSHLPLQTSSARGTGRAICVAYAYRTYVGGVAPVIPSLLKPATAFNTLIRVYPLNRRCSSMDESVPQ